MELTDRDLAICVEAANAWRHGNVDVIRLHCFNQEEAEIYRGAVLKLVPGAQVEVTWLRPFGSQEKFWRTREESGLIDVDRVVSKAFRYFYRENSPDAIPRI